ncbi:ferritin-like domain-containing protein [Polyangium mundeleinium]|uniref:Ferritin-like domain-containing protein n=1 Tax=Polyangium mundeleinium TaxID=2995306 RepID=A0ABT5F6T2_9BACT|nr:ferritin-like domain-containing protein [Polyangium mundeleinium]MDC0749334.1 ferritin-like domain-containing protein [Polyangium mundeleinium]
MARSNRVGRILRHVLSLSIAPAAVACGIDTEGFSVVTCGSDRDLSDVRTAEELDFMQLVSIDEGGPSEEPRVVATFGTKCGSASNVAMCEAAIAAATSAQGFRLGQCVDFCPRHILVTNKGDEVEVLETKEAVLDLIRPIDTAVEAVLAAELAEYHVSCNDADEGGVRASGSGFDVLGTRYTEICDPIVRELYLLRINADGNVQEIESEVIESESGACIGRRPAGLARRKARGTTRVGAYLASVAHLEAASVDAFEALAAELAHHGAPRALIQRAGIARRDEVRHARVMRRLASRHGGQFRAPIVAKQAPRSLEAIALDNAVEGCVRETFGALVGMWQARAAKDPAVRRAMRRIALDEARHASLAWAIDEWIRPRLDAAARERVETERRKTLEIVEAEACAGNDPALVSTLGLPDGDAGERLARHFKVAVLALSA